MRISFARTTALLGITAAALLGCSKEPYPSGTGGAGAGGNGTGGTGASTGSMGGMGGTAGGGGSGGTGGACGDQELCGNGEDDDCNLDTADDDLMSCVLQAGAPDALVARYFINETDGATELADAAPDEALALTLVDPDDNAELQTFGSHKGLNWDLVGLPARASAPILGTKVQSRLDQKQKATIEVVVDVDEVSASTSPIVWIGEPQTDGQLSLTVLNMERATFTMNGSLVGRWQVNFSSLNRVVLHLVLDTTLADAPSRVRLYVDGEPATVDPGTTPPGENVPINVAASHVYTLGNVEQGGRSFKGTLFYAALYDAALDDDIVENNAFVLDANDDGP